MGQEKNTSVKKNGQSMNPFRSSITNIAFFFPFAPFALNPLNCSDSGSTTSLSSSTGHAGPCFSMDKVDIVTSSAIAAPVVASDVKPSQLVNNSVTKIVTSSKTAAKVSSFNIVI